MRYATAAAFRDALEHRLRARATEHLVGVNVRRKQVAIDRFLARLTIAAPGRWVVRGAYALDLRLGFRGRATRDVDLTRIDSAAETLRDMHDASAVVGGDYFRFGVERSRRSLRPDTEPTSRFRVAADLAGRRFDDFTVNTSFGELMLEEPDLIEGPNFLAFAGIPRTPVPAIPLKLQIAEKVHAYTRIYGPGRSNTRVKNLVDLVPMARKSKIRAPNSQRLCAGRSRRAALMRSRRRCRTRQPTRRFRTPCLQRRSVFRSTSKGAHRLAANLVGPVPQGTIISMWDLTDQNWQGLKVRA